MYCVWTKKLVGYIFSSNRRDCKICGIGSINDTDWTALDNEYQTIGSHYGFIVKFDDTLEKRRRKNTRTIARNQISSLGWVLPQIYDCTHKEERKTFIIYFAYNSRQLCSSPLNSIVRSNVVQTLSSLCARVITHINQSVTTKSGN